jgi:hypothetical protein
MVHVTPSRRLLIGLGTLVAVAATVGCSATEPISNVDPSPSADQGINMARCLSAKGWAVQRDAGGGWSTISGVPAEQVNQFDSDVVDCKAEFGYDKKLEITAKQAEGFYDKLVASAECLRGLGFEISEPPSRQAFVETLVGGELPAWAPYSQLIQMGASRDEFETAEKECPQPTSW